MRRISIKRRQRAVSSALKIVIVSFFVATGGLTGVLLGALVVNFFSPGHPIYVSIKQTLESLF